LSEEDVRAIAQMTTKDIKTKYYLKTAKTALNWRGYAIEEVKKMDAAKVLQS
jgi:hypothetical protein